MTGTQSAVTTALTGHLTFYLLVAAALTYPVSLALLHLYNRAVRGSMRSVAHRSSPAERQTPAVASNTEASAAGAAALESVPRMPIGDGAERLRAELLTRPRRAAVVYVVAGAVYGVVTALAQLVASGIEVRPVQLLFLSWTFAWPVVPSIAIVAGLSRREKVMLVGAYFAGLIVMGAIEMPVSPDLTWSQVFLPWIMYDLPATLLLLTYLSRPIRAVGPLVLVFLLVALIGTGVILSVVGSDERYLRSVVSVAMAIGLDASSTFLALQAIGFLAFALFGWAALLWIGRRYQAKALSDESVSVDAIWALFTIAYAMDLAFEYPLWTLSGLVALAIYAVCVRAGFSWLRRREAASERSPVLLVLRSFSIGRASERLFETLGRRWRRVGSIQMIAGVDLATRTVEPHEFLDFLTGRLSRRFISGEEQLNTRMQERDLVADRDLTYRVNEFFCYDDTWKMVLSRLVHDSDAVLMDLRGFSQKNAGCIFELHELARATSLDRVVFITDRSTDDALLAQSIGSGRAGVLRVDVLDADRTQQLMTALAAAATRA